MNIKEVNAKLNLEGKCIKQTQVTTLKAISVQERAHKRILSLQMQQHDSYFQRIILLK